MPSSLYECQVMHARFAPRAHRFVYRIFLFALDLDELPALHRSLRLFSAGRRNLYSFRDADYLPTGQPGSLKQRVLTHLAAQGIAAPADARVLLITLPRIAGYLFNPVSFYFCFDRAGTPLAAITEVTNTFREVKPYVLAPTPPNAAPHAPAAHPAHPPDTHAAASATFRLRVPKHFYVSPYSDVDVAFDFTLRCPGDRLSIQIDDYTGATRTLTSTVHGFRHALSDTRLAWFTLKYPLLSLRIIALIHWHALVLWLKRVPWFAKTARPADQRDLFRPHHSLQPRDTA